KVVLPSNPFGALVSKIGLHEGSAVEAPYVAQSIARLLPGMENRLRKQSKNARMLAKMLMDHPSVKNVRLAGFHSDPANDARTQQYLGNSHFVLLVDLYGGAKAAEKFINTRQFLHAVALGQRVTAVSHPASSTH